MDASWVLANLTWLLPAIFLAPVLLFVIVELIQELRYRRAFLRWVEREGTSAHPEELSAASFRVREAQRSPRARFLRRIKPGMRSIRFRGLAPPEWKTPGD